MIYLKSLILIIYTILLAALTLVMGLFDRKGVLHGKIMRHWARTLLVFSKVKYDIEGTENLAQANPALIIINHESALDIPVAIAALPINLRFIFKIELLYIPIFGWAMWQGKHIAINRSKPKQAIRAINSKSGDIITRKQNIIIAPEGTRYSDGKIGPFKKGGFKIAEKYDIPIIPVTMIGNRFCNPKNSMKIYPGKVRVVIGPAVKASQYENLDDCIQDVRAIMIAAKEKHEPKLEASRA
ncbi:MAG: lysophospholipid acyltransferase family protein [Fidelibacterota bacterium]